ncbi:MAG: hypothetical protein C4532_16340 [Candidatus Abyssobacteria bacterium SURF_17]|jgi:hypothetical protein|uniref:Polysulfide reductase n=1 Tax=Candidatus Abyssobacteria bacterium SURF_17 TaxID=2093361 RepID=A0A419ES44_9BACT|nr:MAG: hypothetical protein C4532_16340 [Candidatus Abyssubacteria bacterium SURF_17]
MNSLSDLFWQAYVYNFLFWAGLAQGIIIFAAVLNITGARWGRRYIQLGSYAQDFLTACVVLYVILLFGRTHIFPWIAHPVPEKAAYLNVPFLAARGLVGLAILALLSRKFLASRGITSSGDRENASPWAVALVMAFMVVFSYLAFDLIMSLEPEWYSTLLGAHYAVGSFYLGIAGLCIIGIFRGGVPSEDRRKLSQLLFGFSLFWVSLLWSQYIVIWYGDIPAEARFLYLRFYQAPWKNISYAVLALAFVFPFVMLMPMRAKMIGLAPLFASFSIALGLFFEKYLLVIPSLSPQESTFGWVHLLVTALFGALFVASYRRSMRRALPIMEVSSGGQHA